jgi:D-alanyl-D-alanine dipeptidase
VPRLGPLVLPIVLGALLTPAPAHGAALVDVRRAEPSIRVDVRYATERNFTGARLPGYCKGRALLLGDAARRLARVHRALRTRGLGLLVLDAYRPARASRAMVRWARRTGRDELLSGGYIAARSNHNLGTTVDLTLIRRRSGAEVDMGTDYDAFTPRSSTTRARGRALRNRLTLRNAMEGRGFVNYHREWWHYDSVEPGPRRLDVPIGC